MNKKKHELILNIKTFVLKSQWRIYAQINQKILFVKKRTVSLFPSIYSFFFFDTQEESENDKLMTKINKGEICDFE